VKAGGGYEGLQFALIVQREHLLDKASRLGIQVFGQGPTQDGQ
jgi:hypothetical protein